MEVVQQDVRFATRDPGEFESQIRDFAAGPVRIEAVRGSRFRSEGRAWGLPRMPMFQVGMDGGRVVAPARTRVLGLTVALAGSFEARMGTKSASFEPGACHVVGSADLDLSIPRNSVLVLNAEVDLLEEKAQKLIGAELREGAIEPRLSLVTPEGALFWRRFASIWRDLRAGAPRLRTARGMMEAEAALAEGLVGAVLGIGAHPPRECGPLHLRLAEEFILGRLGDPISRADVCAAAGVGERSLSRAFARRHGVGPMTFLKQRRLDAAHRALLAADPAERGVSTIARECGLSHLGRFSVEYRHIFGESPSATLRR